MEIMDVKCVLGFFYPEAHIVFLFLIKDFTFTAFTLFPVFSQIITLYV